MGRVVGPRARQRPLSETDPYWGSPKVRSAAFPSRAASSRRQGGVPRGSAGAAWLHLGRSAERPLRHRRHPSRGFRRCRDRANIRRSLDAPRCPLEPRTAFGGCIGHRPSRYGSSCAAPRARSTSARRARRQGREPEDQRAGRTPRRCRVARPFQPAPGSAEREGRGDDARGAEVVHREAAAAPTVQASAIRSAVSTPSAP